MAVISKDLGPVSAYAVAVANGFTGTEAEWEQYIANASTAAQSAAGSATAAANSASAAAQSATAAAASQVAAAGSETEAANYALVAGNHAMAAAASATAAETAETGAETAQAAAEAAQAAAEAVAESIPEDYTELTEEVGSLKSALGTVDGILSYDEVDIPFTEVNPGYYIRYSNGALQSSSDFCTTDYIDLTKYAAVLYKRNKTTTSTPTNGMAFYDAEKTYITGVRAAANQDGNGYLDDLSLLPIPSGAVYARFTVWMDSATRGEFALRGRSKIAKQATDVQTVLAVTEDILPMPGTDWSGEESIIRREGCAYTMNGSIDTAAMGRGFLDNDIAMSIMGGTWNSQGKGKYPITMRPGQVLRIEKHNRGGTIQPNGNNVECYATWCWDGSVTVRGTNVWTDYGNYCDIAYDPEHPVVHPVLYFTRNGTVYEDVRFDIIMRDISAGAQNQIYADTAPLELGTAKSNHSVGELIICKNQLYEVTAAIASGETITPGTNVTATTIAAQLAAIKAQLANN